MKTGGPAFPCVPNPSPMEGIFEDYIPGMSLRDHFAGKAIEGWAANGELKIELKEHGPFGDMANWAYQLADAMLVAREEGGSS